jgi:hypothetical protein
MGSRLVQSPDALELPLLLSIAVAVIEARTDLAAENIARLPRRLCSTHRTL